MSDPFKPRAAFAPWDRRELPGLFSVEETARRVGAYKWLEMRLFESLGGWVATVPELDVKLVLGRHCYHHAWHAELMDKRLPELREMNTERLTEPANAEMEAFVEALREPEAPEHTIEKLVGVYRVLIPRKIAAYTYHLNGTSRITDSPTQRSLGFMLQDEFDDWREGEMLLQSLIETPEELERASRRQQELEAIMLAAGGIAGPGSLGAWKQPKEPRYEEATAPRDAGARFALRPHVDHGSGDGPAEPEDRRTGPRLRPARAPAARRGRPGPQPDARHLHR